MRCPTLQESINATLALLPRGRAWGREFALPEKFLDPAFQFNAFQNDAFEAVLRAGSTIYRFFAAFGAVRNYLETQLCALRLEFWCATQTETRDLWMKEYGLPDDCDPFPDLCTKVAALGGTRCEYFNSVVSRLGWTVDCVDATLACGSHMGCAYAGQAKAGSARANILQLIVHTADSPAFTGMIQTPPLAGLLTAGNPLACAPDLSGLRCLMDRIAPAHVTISYTTI